MREERPDLGEGDVEGYGELAEEFAELELEVWWLTGHGRYEGVNEVASEFRHIWSCDNCTFRNGQGDECEPAPVCAPLKVAQKPEDVHEDCAGAVVRNGLLDADGEVVADCGAIAPFVDGRTEAVVCESCCWVEQNVLCCLQ